MAQIESQVGGETEASLKTAIEGVLAGVKVRPTVEFEIREMVSSFHSIALASDR